MKIELYNRWDDVYGLGDKYVELRLNKSQACCVKKTASGLTYVMECGNGKTVYSFDGGADFPLRNLTDAEMEEVLYFVREQFEAEERLEEEFNDET